MCNERTNKDHQRREDGVDGFPLSLRSSLRTKIPVVGRRLVATIKWSEKVGTQWTRVWDDIVVG